MSAYKLTAKRRAEAVWYVAQRFNQMRAQVRSAKSSETPEETLARAAADVAATYPQSHAHAVGRMNLHRRSKPNARGGIDLWVDLAKCPATWKRRERLHQRAHDWLQELREPQQQQQPQQQPPAPPPPPVTVKVIGEIDGKGATYQAATDPLKDGAEVMRLVNAKLDGTPPQQRVIYDDPLAAGSRDGRIDYAGEAQLRAALVDALRERRRGRELRGLDSGELDLARIAPTALGVDLERAYSRRIRPDVRGVAVAIMVDASSSMKADGRGIAARRGACLAYRALARERVAVAVAQYGAPAARQYELIARFGAPQSQALAALERMDYARSWGTDAALASARGLAMLARRTEPRRVMMFLCDEDVDADNQVWTQAARAGVEVWPILLGTQAERARDQIAAAGWSAIPPIVAVYPAQLVPRWTAAIREHLGRARA